MNVKVLAPAKINLGLEILGKRADGYHEIDTIMQSIDLCDEIDVKISNDKSTEVLCNKNIGCISENNIVYKAAKIFFEYIGIKNPGVKIKIKKNIPVSAGLAGGSSDGAATLIALDYIFKTNLNKFEILNLGAKLGTDVPFCILGGTARAKGTGIMLETISSLKNCFIVIVKPPISVSTKKAYDLSDSVKNKNINKFDLLLSGIKNNDLKLLSNNLFNRFEEVISEKIVFSIKKDLCNMGALGALMSGSGPTVFGIFEDEHEALKCMNKIKNFYPQNFLCKPLSVGAYIL